MNSSFIVRVELHGVQETASEATYVRLHTAMANSGFSRTIRADNGHIYWLPTAMYSTSSSMDSNTIGQLAVNAANTTGVTSSILVAQMNSWSGPGLILQQ